MKQKLILWWEKRKKTVLTVGIIAAVLLLSWVCYYTVYQNMTGNHALTNRLNLSFGSSGDEISVREKGRKEQLKTVLIVGIDAKKETQPLVYCIADAEKETVRFLAVPGAALSDCERNDKKISYAYRNGGMDQLKGELKQLTGLPTDRYVIINEKDFCEMTDLLGGLTFSVPQEMKWEGTSLLPGEQKLDGKQTCALVNFDGYANGDLGRLRTLQNVLHAYLPHAVQTAQTPKELAKIFSHVTETDLSAGELLWLSKLLIRDQNLKEAPYDILPGLAADFLKTSYYIVNETATLGLLNSGCNPYEKPIKSLHLSNIGQNLFDGGQWDGDAASSGGFSPDMEGDGKKDPTRFCEYYYEYESGKVPDSLFADAMDTPDKSKKEKEKDKDKASASPAPSPTPRPVLPTPKLIAPSPTPEVVERDRYIVLDPGQNPEDYGIDPSDVQYLTPPPDQTEQSPEETPAQQPTFTFEPGVTPPPEGDSSGGSE